MSLGLMSAQLVSSRCVFTGLGWNGLNSSSEPGSVPCFISLWRSCQIPGFLSFLSLAAVRARVLQRWQSSLAPFARQSCPRCRPGRAGGSRAGWGWQRGLRPGERRGCGERRGHRGSARACGAPGRGWREGGLGDTAGDAAGFAHGNGQLERFAICLNNLIITSFVWRECMCSCMVLVYGISIVQFNWGSEEG